jgi:hypothetical protein
MFSRRDIITFICALLVTGALTVWGTNYFIKKYIDPLARAGGLEPDK